MKVVLDTNVLVSGLLQSLGNPGHILALVLAGAAIPCHNDLILAEYAEVLARPRFKFDSQKVREVLHKIKVDGLSTHAELRNDLGLPDPDDEPFLAVALSAPADFLITGNLIHFPSSKRRGCAVVSPAEFMEYWRKSSKR